MRDALASWVLRYVQAWNSNHPEEVGKLFSDDAKYFRRPGGLPWKGRDEIVEGWIEHADEPGSWNFSFEILGVDDGVGFVHGRTDYAHESDYDNLWVVRLNGAGECTEFTEWFMVDPESAM